MARKIVLPNGKVAYITNRVADDSLRESMENFILQETEETRPVFEAFYSVLRCIARRETLDESHHSGSGNLPA